MKDAMLTELYRRVFDAKREAGALQKESGEDNDRLLQVAYAKNKLLSELIDIRTEQIRQG